MTFGTGIHGCVGQAVARLESEAIFGALAKRVASFELTGEPKRRLNNTLARARHPAASHRTGLTR